MIDDIYKSELDAVTHLIDEQFGEGFAKQNPTLVGAYLIKNGIESLVSAIEYLGEKNG